MSGRHYHEVPGNIVCSACHKTCNEYPTWNFERGKQAVCTPCYTVGYRFDAIGNVIDKRGRVVGVRS